MFIGQNPKSESLTISEGLIIRLIDKEQFSDAYALLMHRGNKNSTTSVLYNIALCLYSVAAYDESLEYLDLAESKHTVSLTDNFGKTSHSPKLKEMQNNLAIHKNAISDEYCNLFSREIKFLISRLRIENYLKLELWNNIMDEVNKLEGRTYPDVDFALEQVNLNKK